MSKMKMSKFAVGIFLTPFLFFLTPTRGHEVWIDVEKADATAELEAELDVSLFWGHFPDDLDSIDSDAYALYVRRPDGEVEELTLEPGEKRLTSSYAPPSHGQYVFWSVRHPSTFAPADGPRTLSIQTAKAVYYMPAKAVAVDQAEKAVEIVPKNNLQGFKRGYAEFLILIDGQPAPDAAVNLYGTDGTELSGSSDQDGIFGFNIPSGGEWLLKANLRGEDFGELDGEEYEAVSRTATLRLTSGVGFPEADNCEHCQTHQEVEDGHTHAHAHDHHHDHEHETAGGHGHEHDHGHAGDFWKNAAVFIAGSLMGGAGVLFVLGMKKRG